MECFNSRHQDPHRLPLHDSQKHFEGLPVVPDRVPTVVEQAELSLSTRIQVTEALSYPVILQCEESPSTCKDCHPKSVAPKESPVSQRTLST